MAFWLLKTEPDVYSYADLCRDGQTVWDGVNNNLALKYIRTMQPQDQALIYHTGDERRAMGIASVTSLPYADPQLGDPKRAVVDLVPLRSLSRPVSLAIMKQDALLTGTEEFPLFRIARLSVVPVPDICWHRILELSD
ncbi:MAG: EVE domain-containing protein [Oscillatoriales cyanobacterium SM2_2_1]|nr:EVE domain-containing protein [Oscillatoriales cyanobacterium SM2_2_1]